MVNASTKPLFNGDMSSKPPSPGHKPCRQCGGRGSYPPPTRQVCSRCKGSCIEPGDTE